MIKTVYLFTNRNTMIFDENDNQLPEFQLKIGWGTAQDVEGEREVLRQIHEDKPECYLAKWREYRSRISITELAAILGHGPWYERELRNKKEV